jgi:hypothetical protein
MVGMGPGRAHDRDERVERGRSGRRQPGGAAAACSSPASGRSRPATSSPRTSGCALRARDRRRPRARATAPRPPPRAAPPLRARPRARRGSSRAQGRRRRSRSSRRPASGRGGRLRGAGLYLLRRHVGKWSFISPTSLIAASAPAGTGPRTRTAALVDGRARRCNAAFRDLFRIRERLAPGGRRHEKSRSGRPSATPRAASARSRCAGWNTRS